MRFFLKLMVVFSLALFVASCADKFPRYTGPEVTAIVVHKADRRLFLVHNDQILKAYNIALGGNPHGAKQFEGDMKTPEGTYFINRQNPRSSYYLSLGISYPNNADRAFAASMGKRPGGDIFIHGRDGKNKGHGKDWTAGCIAVKDKEIREIYSMVRVGTPIFIKP